MPGVKLLEDMRQRAMINAGAIVELPFGDDVQSFNLTVTRDVTHGSWLWMMYRDDGFNAGLEWSQITHDADSIYNLINNSNMGFTWNKPVQTFPTSAKPSPASADDDQAAKTAKGTLQGNLENIRIANLLQSINMGQMTGRLEIISPEDTAAVFYLEGNPVHATLRGAVGMEALVQLQAWQRGEFTFYNGPINVTTTINRGLISLLMEGATFVDHLTYLENSGLTHDAYPVQVKEVSFDKALTTGVDSKFADVKLIYDMIDGAKTWAEIQRDLELTKNEWVPVMFSLLNSGAVRISSTPTKSTHQIKSKDKMDWAALEVFEQSISRSDSGLFTHSALLFFLSQEWYRYEETKRPFSLIVFGYCRKSTDSVEPQFIPFRARAVEELREKVFKTKRKYDLLCHSGSFSYAMLLPFTLKKSAIRQAEILGEICGSVKISEDYAYAKIEFRAGIANIPEDCTSLDEMIAIAEKVTAFSG